MKCYECEDGKIRSINHVIMQAMFIYERGKELDYTFGEYAIVGFEKTSSPVSSGHILSASEDFDECARKLAEYRYELENFPDDDPEAGAPGKMLF